jgi:hypothetical protein
MKKPIKNVSRYACTSKELAERSLAARCVSAGPGSWRFKFRASLSRAIQRTKQTLLFACVDAAAPPEKATKRPLSDHVHGPNFTPGLRTETGLNSEHPRGVPMSD